MPIMTSLQKQYASPYVKEPIIVKSTNPYEAPAVEPLSVGTMGMTWPSLAGIKPNTNLYEGNIPLTDSGSQQYSTYWTGVGGLNYIDAPVEELWPSNYVDPSTVNFGGGGGGGYSGGGGGKKQAQPEPLEWGETYSEQKAPSWWKGMTPTKGMNAEAGYASMMNALIPFMSPEDQRYYGQNLARLFPEAFGEYGNVDKLNFEIPTDVTAEMRNWYTSADRAQGIQDILTTMLDTSQNVKFNQENLGPGYTYFQNIGQVLEDFGGTVGSPGTPDITGETRAGGVPGRPIAEGPASFLGGKPAPEGMGQEAIDPFTGQPIIVTSPGRTEGGDFIAPPSPTEGAVRPATHQEQTINIPGTPPTAVSPQTRRQFEQLQAALDPLIAETNAGVLSPFAAAVRSLTMPMFSAEQLVPRSQLPSGAIRYGVPTGGWF
jgi:hypothetical protein